MDSCPLLLFGSVDNKSLVFDKLILTTIPSGNPGADKTEMTIKYMIRVLGQKKKSFSIEFNTRMTEKLEKMSGTK